MYTCSKCKKTFTGEPYLGYLGGRKYCDMKCLPNSSMDRPYSFEYFNLVDTIRDIEQQINQITLFEDRLKLEEHINECASEYALLLYGDDENHFYKKIMIELLPRFELLYEKTHHVFTHKKQEDDIPGIILFWDDLNRELGKGVGKRVFDSFQDGLTGMGLVCELDFTDYRNKIFTESMNEAHELEDLLIKSVKKHKSLITQSQLDWAVDECSYVTMLRFCPVCEEWEDAHDFSYDKSLNVNRCYYGD